MPHCYKCHQNKDKLAFHTDYSRILKVMSMCKDCAKAARQLRRRRAKLRNFLAQMAQIR